MTYLEIMMNYDALLREIEVETFPNRPPGGQHVGTSSGVRIRHENLGLEVSCSTHRSQHKNKQIAIDMLLGGLTSPHF